MKPGSSDFQFCAQSELPACRRLNAHGQPILATKCSTQTQKVLLFSVMQATLMTRDKYLTHQCQSEVSVLLCPIEINLPPEIYSLWMQLRWLKRGTVAIRSDVNAWDIQYNHPNLNEFQFYSRPLLHNYDVWGRGNSRH